MFMAPTTPSGVISGNDKALWTPSRATLEPNWGQRLSAPSEGDIMVRPSAAAETQGPWPSPYWISSISDTNLAVATRVSDRPSSSRSSPLRPPQEPLAPRTEPPGSECFPGPTVQSPGERVRSDCRADRPGSRHRLTAAEGECLRPKNLSCRLPPMSSLSMRRPALCHQQTKRTHRRLHDSCDARHAPDPLPSH